MGRNAQLAAAEKQGEWFGNTCRLEGRGNLLQCLRSKNRRNFAGAANDPGLLCLVKASLVCNGD